MKKNKTLILAGLLCVMGALSTSATWAVTPKSPIAWGSAGKNYRERLLLLPR
jgi:Spy/CpxP family protein refolding chaperone